MKRWAFFYGTVAGTACAISRDVPAAVGGVLFGVMLAVLTEWTCDGIAHNRVRRQLAAGLRSPSCADTPPPRSLRVPPRPETRGAPDERP